MQPYSTGLNIQPFLCHPLSLLLEKCQHYICASLPSEPAWMLRAAGDFERSGTKKRRQDDRRSSAARLLLDRNSFPRAQHVEVSIALVDVNARPVHLQFVFQACLHLVIFPFISASCGLPTVQVVYLQQQVHLSAVQRNLLLTLPGCRRFLSRPQVHKELQTATPK